jgi:hypothetical protein
MVEKMETERTRSALEPIERLSEILFGLIMVLTFTSSLSVATAERAEVRMVLIAALGCNIAWGLIDAIMYLMGCLHARGADLKTIMAVRSAGSAQKAHAIIRESVPAVVALELRPEELERIRSRILGMDRLPAQPRFHRDHLRGALGVFLIVVMSTLPVILPFLFLNEMPIAIRLSNAIAVAMLAFIGFAYGRASGLPPWWTSLAMTLLGCVLVGLTIALGG